MALPVASCVEASSRAPSSCRAARWATRASTWGACCQHVRAPSAHALREQRLPLVRALDVHRPHPAPRRSRPARPPVRAPRVFMNSSITLLDWARFALVLSKTTPFFKSLAEKSIKKCVRNDLSELGLAIDAYTNAFVSLIRQCSTLIATATKNKLKCLRLCCSCVKKFTPTHIYPSGLFGYSMHPIRETSSPSCNNWNSIDHFFVGPLTATCTPILCFPRALLMPRTTLCISAADIPGIAIPPLGLACPAVFHDQTRPSVSFTPPIIFFPLQCIPL